MDDNQTLDLYRKALNYNVIGRYDPKIKQLLYHTPHAVLYRYDVANESWEKQDTQGVLAIYLRNVNSQQPEELLKVEDLASQPMGSTASVSALAADNTQTEPVNDIKVLQGEDIYNYGLILLNRTNPENFSLGIVPNSVVNKRKLFNRNAGSPELNNMQIEKNDGLLIIKSLLGQVFGLWVYNEEDRETLYTLIKYLLESEPKDSFI